MNVSVIIPAHNAAGTLAEALASLRAQTFPGWEAIVVDDGSSDETASVAASLAEQDPRIRVVSQPNLGVSAARNVGLRLARFDWLLFLDADDWILPTHLERLTREIISDPDLDAAYCGWTRIAPDGTLLSEQRRSMSGDLFPAFARSCVFAVHACLVRRTLVEAARGFDPSFHICQDWDLWQRIARAGARFGAVPEVLAHYRMRPDSASVAGNRFLTEGLRVIAQGHSRDPRVANPKPDHANGQSPEQLSNARLHFACWPAGLVLGSGQDARPLLQVLKDDHAPGLDPHTVAQSIFEAALIPGCRTPAAWVELWPDLESRVDRFLLALEAQSTTPGLARRARTNLERLIAKNADVSQPLTIGRTYAVRVEVTEPIPDLFPPVPVERVHCAIELGGALLGHLELPVCDGYAPAYVLADAIAAEFAWTILGRFFEHTVYRSLRVEHSPSGSSLWRGSLCLADGLAEDEHALWSQAHDRVGWLVFLQELWMRPDWPNAHFYDPVAVHEAALHCRVDDDWLAVEVGEELPEVEVTGQTLNVIVTIGGVALETVTVPVEANLVTSHALRVALTTAGGFELCRAVVREGLVGQPLEGEMSLRSRLAGAEARRGESNLALPASANVTLTPGSARAISRALAGARSVVLGRRAHAALGTSISRRAMLPAGAARELMEAAAVAGEPVIQFAGPDERPERVIYAPDLISRSPRSTQALGAHRNRPEVQPAEATSCYDRHHFEALFAAQPDPWKYTTLYEQTKYEQTLAMLPPGNIARALELACAEGLFTVQLAPRVGQLLAADISEVALERAAKRCADMKHVHFARLDLTRDPLPGRFDLIVCSEVLYYVGGQDALGAVACKLADALEPGGYLLMAHANHVVDEPDRTGFDWDVPFGAQVIGETFMRVPTLGLVKEFRTPLYRIHLFQREPLMSLPVQHEGPEVIEMMQPTPLSPEIAAHVLWHGGRPRRSGADQAVVTHRLPILMYHRVAPDGSPTLARYRVTPEAFEAQLRYLCEAGFHSVRLDDWRAAVEAHRPLPGRAIHITFDDGYRDFLTNAWPLLKRYGFSATVFLVADRIGQSSSWDRVYGAEFPLLSWPEIHQLADEGVEFGSHSASHPFLTALALEDLVREGAHSRALLECGLGVPVRAFAYPYGDVDRTVQHLVGACGYVFGLSCESRLSSFHDSLLALPRLEVAGSDDLPRFVAKLGM